MLNLRFFLAILIPVLWLVTGFLCLIFSAYKYTDILNLAKISYHNGIFHLFEIKLNESNFNNWRFLIYSISITINIVIIFIILKFKWILVELKLISEECLVAIKSTYFIFCNISKTKQYISLFLLLSIILIRIYYFQNFCITTDEVASFDFFVMEGLFAVTSYYPIPNNHIFHNLLSLGIYKFVDDPVLVMRLPTFLLSLIGTFLIFTILLKYFGFAIAAFTTSFFCISRASIFYSIAGRGYFIITVLAFVSFFSMLHIMYKYENARLYWFIFIITSIFGFYTIPTFLYPFASILLIGLIYFLFNKTNKLTWLIISCIIIGIGTICLYLPILIVSGPDALINNKFINPLKSEVFWEKFPSYLNFTEGWLLGQERLAKYVLLIIIFCSILGIKFKKHKDAFCKFYLPSLILVILPYGFIMIQKVLTPERALLYKIIYVFLLGVCLFFWTFDLFKVNKKIKIIIASFSFLVYCMYQIYYIEKELTDLNVKEDQYKATFKWLIANKSKNIIVLDPYYALYLNHYYKLSKTNGKIYSYEKQGEQIDFLIKSKDLPEINNRLKFIKIGNEVYQDNFIQIFDIK